MKRLLAVSASAGSGKTFRLANRYISLLNVESPVNIVAITFTNKAANEMKERIVKFLKELGNDENVVNMICNEIGINKEELLKRKNNLLEKFLKGDVNIQTIDSFINKILRKFSYFAGVKSNFNIGAVDNEIVFKAFLKSLDEKKFKTLIDIAKKEEKFTKLINLFEELYEKDKELQNLTLLPIKKPDDTKAKNAFNRLKEYILNHELSSNSAIKAVNIDFYEVPYTTWFAKEELKQYSYFKKKGLYQNWFENILVELKKFFKKYFDYIEYEFFKNLFDFYDKYKQLKWKLKKDENLLDFKDIEHLVYSLLREEELNRDFLYFRLDSRVNHILMDEFQDTSITQWEIFEPIIDEIASGIGRKEFRSFFYVGDTKQAIYRFRGGQKELFYEVAKRYKPFGLEVERLDTNYRSAKNIVEFVNEKFDLKEKVKSEKEGYIEVDEITKENAFEKVYEKIKFLNENGVKDRDIAVLVHKNEDILDLSEFLASCGKKAVSAKKAKVISQKSAKAIVSLMKYLNNPKLKIEKLNFLSLIGKKWSEEEIDIKIDRPVLMIKEIIDKFNLLDEASLKLLYHSKKYDTLFDFVKEIDSYEEELPLSEFDGIVIMTIHKSKGLEFDNVIVLDRLSDRENPSGNIVFYYENAKLKDIKLKIPNREIIDKNYSLILKKEERLKEEDKKNAEYVAFTRAKNSLIILKRSEKTKQGKSYSAFVTELNKIQKGKIIPSEDRKEEKLNAINIKIENLGKQTNIIEEEEYKPNDFKSIFLGNAIHYAFECNDIEAVRNIYGDFCDIEKVKDLIEKSKPYLPTGKKEVPFIYEEKVGRMDLYVEGIEVIDYKSTKPKDERAYIKQVRHYVEVVEKLTGKKVKGKIFYVDTQEFKEV
ncbi:RecB-like helicase [Caminibacter sp.]